MAGPDTAHRVEAVDLGCPECGHDELAKMTWLDRLAVRFGAPPLLVCEWRAEIMADYCGCSHPYHSR